jgi:pimeloyl-ACP methyl ester carboxylesterase
MKHLVLILSFIFISYVHAETHTNSLCRNYSGDDYSAQACISIPDDWDRKEVLYYLHSLGGNAIEWDNNKNFQQTMDNFRQAGLHRPLVITISFGPWWVLKDFSFENHPALLKTYLQIQHDTEAEFFKNAQPIKRILVGSSLGGFNSLILLAKTDLHFDKVALLCPAFSEVGPYSTPDEIAAYLKRNRPYVDDRRIYNVIKLLQIEFPTQDEWNQYAPFTIVKDLKTRTDAQFYVTGNTQDEYGFGEGADLLQKELHKMNLKTEYEKIPGRHCTMDVKALTGFLKP